MVLVLFSWRCSSGQLCGIQEEDTNSFPLEKNSKAPASAPMAGKKPTPLTNKSMP